MTADLTPAEAAGKKDAGFGPGLEADELGHESFGTVQFVLDFAEAEVWGSRMDLASCGGFGQGVLGKGFGWNLFAFCGVHFEASIILPSLVTTKEGLSSRPPFRRRERKPSSPGGCCRSQIVLKPPSRQTAKNSGTGSPCCTPLVLGILCGTKLLSVFRVARSTVPCQVGGYSSDFPKKKQERSIWLKAFSRAMVNKHCFSSLSCFWSHRLMAWTLASQPCFGPKPWLCRSEVSGRVFRHLCQQGFCCESSETASYDHPPVPPSFFFKAVSEALAIETMGPKIRTTA